MFHKEGYTILLITAIFFATFSVIALKFLQGPVFYVIMIMMMAMCLLIFRFFRNPKRVFVLKDESIMAPADGKVVAIETVHESEYYNDNRILVSIFMSIHNVHINWYPIPGSIQYFKYHPGKYLVARHPKSSSLNERTTVVITNGNRELLVRQIAGYVARRVVCYASQGKQVKQGEELGFIKFGSRLDLYLPMDSKIHVKLGQKTKGGITEVASFAN